jgi:FixJ family two-component response regulator
MHVSQGIVHIVDDEPEVRDSLSRLLRAAGWSVMTYPTGRAFLERIPDATPGCILLDMGMSGMSGAEVHERLRSAGVTMPVIFLTGCGTLAVGIQAMTHGAFHFLEKPVDEETLFPVIGSAVERDRRLRAEKAAREQIRRSLECLSPREREVLEHVVEGRLNKQIAGEMNIQIKTVKVHRGRVMAKMQVRSVAQLVRAYDRFGTRST